MNQTYISFFVMLLIIVFIVVLFLLSMKKNSTRQFKNEIVSLGVFGTFIGISMGLYSFDATNIKDSMPPLLEGLKTAFVTSGVGIFCSIIISIFKTPQRQSNKKTLADVCDNQEKMILCLNQSLANISTSANTEIIASLESVVKQFNNNLTEQFGDNFKALNSAVKELNTWQNNYKRTIKSHDQSIALAVESVQAVAKIRNEQERSIESVMVNLSQSSNDITTSLKKSTDIVEENLQLLLREANGRL